MGEISTALLDQGLILFSTFHLQQLAAAGGPAHSMHSGCSSAVALAYAFQASGGSV
jgi:hypothetical protein